MIRTGPVRGMFSSPSTVTRVVQAAAIRRTAPEKRGKNGSPLPAITTSSSPSLCRPPPGGIPDRTNDCCDSLLEAVAIGVDDNSVRRGPKRGGPAGSIDGVATPQVGQDLISLERIGYVALHRSSLRPLLGRSVEVDLHGRTGQDNGPYVASGHDDGATGGDLALTRDESCTQFRNPGVVRNGPIHAALTDLGRDVPAARVNVAQSPTHLSH